MYNEKNGTGVEGYRTLFDFQILIVLMINIIFCSNDSFP